MACISMPNFIRTMLLMSCLGAVGGQACATYDNKPVAKAAPPAAATSSKIQVSDAWVRPAVQGQSGTGGFMRIVSPQDATLVGFSSPVAEVAELHEMTMDGDVMRMRAIDALPLPAKQAVELKPGGHHLMLMDLKRALQVGDKIRLTLKLKGADGKLMRQTINVPVLRAAPKATSVAPDTAAHAH